MKTYLLIALLPVLLPQCQAKYLVKYGSLEDNLIDRATKYQGCHERWEAGERKPGVYTIYPNGTGPVQVYCNHTAEVTYMVIQRRWFGNENFNRPWNDYKYGFGNIQGDFWIGLEVISQITRTAGSINLRIDLTDWSNFNQTLVLTNFKVNTEYYCYRMSFSGYSGALPNDFASINNMCFWTWDKADPGNCAIHQHCGWWFNPNAQCTYALLNGVYYKGGHYTPPQYYDGIYYKDWRGFDYSMKYVTMSLYK